MRGQGAAVFGPTGSQRIAPYRSEKVFKIGTGDIFSAAFTYYWAEQHLDPADAADKASRAVAEYCSRPQLPLTADAGKDASPIHIGDPGTVLLLGPVRTLGDQWMLEEARLCIKELGASVCCPALGDSMPTDRLMTSALALVDYPNIEIERAINRLTKAGTPVIFLSEEPGAQTGDAKNATSDFATAIYFSVWASLRG